MSLLTSPEPSTVAQDYAQYVNPAFVRLLGTFGYGRVFTRARGTSLWDDQGREYLDMLAAFGAANLGANHPALVQRMISLLGVDAVHLVHVGPQRHAAALAKELASRLPSPLEVSMLSNSGGEAVEAAMKLARAATGRTAIVYAKDGFHGTGFGSLSIMGQARMRRPFEPLVPDCHEVPFGDVDALARVLREERPAAFVVEPLQAEGGVVMAPPGYLAEAQRLCQRFGALFVLDEVQTGLGRTGKLFAFQHEGFVPDVLVLGKSLGGGIVPISATITSRELHQRAYGSQDKFDLHGSTYSGNALACEVARAVLELTDAEGLALRSAERGEYFLSELRARLAGHPLVREVRGRGLLLGVELGTTDTGLLQRMLPSLVDGVSEKVLGQWLCLRLLEQGIVCQPASQKWNVLRFEPALVVTREEIDRTVLATAQILGEYSSIAPLLKDVALRLGEQYRAGWAFR